MARPLRIEVAGGLYHVTARGDRREDIYADETDRLHWLSIFGDVCDRFNWRCHGYCLMTNHYHLVVETPEANLSRGMRQLNGVYTQTFNRRHGLVGHLFQGRFKGILVEREAYLLELSRYVVLNPVRAGMVSDAGDWPWSSYRAMLGKVGAPDWLETDEVFGRFGQDRVTARRRSWSLSGPVWDFRASGLTFAIRFILALRVLSNGCVKPWLKMLALMRFREPSADRHRSPWQSMSPGARAGMRQCSGRTGQAVIPCVQSPIILGCIMRRSAGWLRSSTSSKVDDPGGLLDCKT